MARSERRDSNIKALLNAWPGLPNPPCGALIQVDGTVTARHPFYREGQSREEFIEEGNRLLQEQGYPLLLLDAGMVVESETSTYFKVTFASTEPTYEDIRETGNQGEPTAAGEKLNGGSPQNSR